MKSLKTIWLLTLTTILVATICWSLIRLTTKAEKVLDATHSTLTTMQQNSKITNAWLESAGTWASAFFPASMAKDIAAYSREYYDQYGRDDIKSIFDVIKGEAAKRRLSTGTSTE